ncbi:MAG: GSCFA domain-containing protein [Marinilabiliales bacterium]|nr:GSCFA domain-containing protein [Marinilabiliales bacterium]
MNTFRTEILPPVFSRKLSYQRTSLMIGSCFTENIGEYLKEHLMPVCLNPCGILYNPLSMARCMQLLMQETTYPESKLFLANERWQSFDFHGRYAHSDKQKAWESICQTLETGRSALKTASHLFLTFGTSWIYRDKTNGDVVANCHKLPASSFVRERVSPEEMATTWETILDELFWSSPEIQVILTISPIRHLKDGSYENQVSKSGLFLLTDHLISRYGKDRVAYFPSYEFVMDELRDYRFYATDMIHLNEVALSFVQEKFDATLLDEESQTILKQISSILRAISHRPFQENSHGYRGHLQRTQSEIRILQEKYPFLNCSELEARIHQKMEL